LVHCYPVAGIQIVAGEKNNFSKEKISNEYFSLGSHYLNAWNILVHYTQVISK